MSSRNHLAKVGVVGLVRKAFFAHLNAKGDPNPSSTLDLSALLPSASFPFCPIYVARMVLNSQKSTCFSVSQVLD